nr:retrovirus-related Pol polyprotein from transposon TNT 1-94 [Tanacetum cinerariifolium]
MQAPPKHKSLNKQGTKRQKVTSAWDIKNIITTQRSSVVQQPNAQRIPKPSVLGKPTPFSDPLERRNFPKTRSILKTNVSKGLSKPVTAQTLPQAAKKVVSNTNVLRPRMYRIDNRTAHTRAPQLLQTFRNTNPHVSTSPGVNHKPTVSRPQLKSNQSRDKVLLNNSQVKVKKTQVEVHPRIPSVSNKIKSVTACKDSFNSKTLNDNAVCATCNKCLVDSNHFVCVTKMLNDVHARTKKPIVVHISTRKPKSQANNSIATSNKEAVASKSTNQKPQSYFRGNDLLIGKRGSDLYTISLQESTSSTPLCLMAKATPTQAWLWHRRLSHLNFDYINLLSKKDIVIGLPKLKYVKDELCSSCELSTAKRSSFKSKVVPSSKGRLNLLYLELCGPMRVASINKKKYILVIVDDYSRYTWTLFLRSKDETPEVLKDFLTMIQRNLQAPVITVRTDRGTEFLNKTLNAFFKEEGIEHQTSTARTPKQNGVVERRNHADLPSQQELDLLFGPLYDEFFNAEGEELQDDKFTNLFCAPAQVEAESSSHNIGNSNVPTFNQPHISKYRWTKDHPLEQEELHQFNRLQVWELFDKPSGKSIIKLKWLWKNKKDKDQTVIRNKARLVAKGTQVFSDFLDGRENGISQWSTEGGVCANSWLWRFGSRKCHDQQGYYVECLNHNLFSVGQFCDVDLEVAFRKSTCFVRDLQGNNLLIGNRGFDLYTISLQESTSSTPLCLMAKATPTQAWLWHRRLSPFNFDYINLLSKKDIVIGLPKLKYVKDQLCSSCELSKAKRSSFKSKAVLSLKERLNLLHMDLCGPMRVASINVKKYILVILDDYSRYTWTLFLHSKDKTPEVLKDFLTVIQRNLQASVITVRTDRGTEFLNKTLNAFLKKEGIEHQTSTARTPK